MVRLKEIKDSFLNLIFPHVCAGCGRDVLAEANMLCMRCVTEMPETNFEIHPDNPVEKIFWGRLPLEGATAQFYFTKESLMQHLMHQFKYRGNKELGFQLGRIMGDQLKKSNRFNVDALIPLPLFPDKEKRRGYNQASVLCQAIAEYLDVPVLDKVITRPRHTDTQTKKGRLSRWTNIEGKFELINAEMIKGKHLLIIDDIITTGATLESCGNELLKGNNVRLSIATFCKTSH